MRERSYISVKLLRLALGAFFIVLGITGVFRDFGEEFFSLTSGYSSLEVIFGVSEIICGLLLLLGFLLFSSSRAVYWGGFIVLIFWILRIVLTKFIWNGLVFINNGNFNIPLFVNWLLVFTCELVIAAALLVIIRRYD